MSEKQQQTPKTRKKWPWVVGGVVVFLGIVGSCTGGGNTTPTTPQAAPPASSSPATPTTEETTPAPETEAPSPAALPEECLPVPETLTSGIATGFKEGVTYDGNAIAVKSDDYQSAYMIAMDLTTPFSPDDVGVYVVGSLDETSGVRSADEISATFADWPTTIDASQDLEFTAADHGVSESKRCLEQSLEQ